MTSEIMGRIIDEAAAWHAASIRDDMDWDGFTHWLEADPRHRNAYDEVALADVLLDDHVDVLHADRDHIEPPTAALQARTFGWKRWAGAAIAASLVALIAVPQLRGPEPVRYETSDTRREIALSDGSQIILAPRSSLTVEGRQQDHIALSGGAWFDIRHNSARPLTIQAGGAQISDIGTQFDVQANDGDLRIEVASGEVQIAAQGLSQPIRLGKGRSLFLDRKQGTAEMLDVGESDTGEWRSGRLTYSSTPLSLVAADLSRYAGVRISLSEPLRNRRFSGTLVIGNGEAAIDDLAQLMGLEVKRSTGSTVLRER